MNKTRLSNFIRKTGMLLLADRVRFYMEKRRNLKVNREFLKENPGIKLPPDYLIYESFQLNYRKYYTESRETAQWLATLLQKHVTLNHLRVLDWGCGPGRVIRHLPEVFGNENEFYGTDYNKKSIGWCSENLPEISFNHNSLRANLPYKDDFLDIIYGISIFTHLSEQMHYDWFNELQRVLKPGGILVVTTQGDNFKTKLTEAEVTEFNKGSLVVRGNVKEGHRTYSAFQPASFMKNLFKKLHILEHIVKKPNAEGYIPQDVWIVQKPGKA